MEFSAVSIKKYIINYGIILGILSVLIGATLYLTNNLIQQNTTQAILSLAVLFGVIAIGIKSYKNANNGFLELSEALKIGIGIALVGGMITVLWTIILMKVIEPDMINIISEIQREKTIEQFPDISEEKLNERIEMVKKSSSPYIISAFGLIWNLFLGFIVSLIGGLIMQNKKGNLQ